MSFAFKKFVVILPLVVILVFSLVQVTRALSGTSHDPPWVRQLTEQDKADMALALAFLTNVVGLDMTKYNATASVTTYSADPNIPVIFDEEVHYNLTSAGRRPLDAICLFRGNSLYWCKLYYPVDELPFFAQPATPNALSAAKSLLDRIHNFSAATYLTTMRSMLDSVAEPKDSTISMGNVAQKISVEGDAVEIMWTSSINGVEDKQKAVCLRLEDGHFQFFCDNWNLYKIGNANVNISEQEAIQIAMEAARAYSWTAGNQTISNVTVLDTPASVKLSMQNRGNYTLYPLWDILLPLDKVYPGLISGIHVLLWADTGEVSFITATGGGGVTQTATSPTPSLAPPILEGAPEPAEYGIVMIAMLIAAIASIASYLFYKRKR